jgi:hypothetical protein
MKKNYSIRPAVEVLSDRTVPALLLQLDGGGNLTGIFGVPDGDVDLLFTADDEVNVVEDGNDLGTYAMPGNLTVSLGNVVAGTLLNIDFAGSSMSGSLKATLGNSTGGYDVDVVDGTIAGSLSIRTGNGADTVGVTDMTIGGNLAVDTNNGGDIIALDGVTVEGNANVADAGVSVVGSDIEGSFAFTLAEGLSTTVGVDADSSILGNASFTFNRGGDTLNLSGTVQGNAVVRMNGGDDDMLFDGTVLGSFTYVGGSRAASLGLSDDLAIEGFIGGNFTASLNGGDDEVAFDGATILGSSISVLGGTGDDTAVVGAGGLTAPGARFTFLGGNGDDTVDWSAAIPDIASAYLDGGFGLNIFDDGGGPITFPIVLRNFV